MGVLNELLVHSLHYLLFKPRNDRKLCYYEDLALNFRFVLVERNPHLLVSFKNGNSNDYTSNSNKISKSHFGAPSSVTATTLTPNITSRRKKSCKVILFLKLSKNKNAFSSSKLNWISFGFKVNEDGSMTITLLMPRTANGYHSGPLSPTYSPTFSPCPSVAGMANRSQCFCPVNPDLAFKNFSEQVSRQAATTN